MAITKAEAKQRRWVKQRIGYLESDNARIVKSIHQRLSDLEVLLLSPTKTPAYAVYEVDGLADAGLPEPKFGSSLVDCPQCRELLKSWDALAVDRHHQRFHGALPSGMRRSGVE